MGACAWVRVREGVVGAARDEGRRRDSDGGGGRGARASGADGGEGDGDTADFEVVFAT